MFQGTRFAGSWPGGLARVVTSISVILPFRNAAETLDAALYGLLVRPCPRVEVLAIDDGSVDGGAERVRRWASRDPRLRLLRNHGRGLVSALNTGLREAKGTLIARMDADDECDPLRLEKQAARLDQAPEIAVLGCRVEAVNGGAGLAHYLSWQNALLTPEDHRRELFVESPLCHPSVMMRREAVEAAFGYRDTSGPEDYDLWLRLDALGYRFEKLPEVLLLWHHREGRATFSDPRYALPRMREAKAPFLAARLSAMRGKRLVVWGAGPTGRRLMRALEAYDLRADLFIDIDPAKIDRRARGASIASPDALDCERDQVVAAVGARGARDLIRNDLTARGFVEGENAWFAA